ncbi:MAG: YdeI/OmpD-associated family protein [Pseudomonadota bacterium]
MPTIDPRIDAYIAEAPEFAQPILTHLREVIHAACPQVQETMKWSRPHFEYNGLLCGMAAFKAHCGFGFWKGSLMFPGAGEGEAAAGNFGRITSVKDLPSKKVLAGYVKQAMQLNDEGAKTPARVKPATPRALTVPDYFQAALRARAEAQEKFEAGSTSFKREYVDWLDGAKTEATRLRRVDQALEWIAEGKGRNWKYEKC